MNLEIANRLLAYRRAHGLSQEELAEKLGVSRQAVSKWERAEAAPDTDNLIALAALYGVLIDELINGKDEPQAQSEEKQSTDDRSEERKTERESQSEQEENMDEGFTIIADDGDRVVINKEIVRVIGSDGEKVVINKNGVHIVDDNICINKNGDVYAAAGGVQVETDDDAHGKTTIQGHIELEFDSWLFPIAAILCTIAYLIMGFCLPRGWECGWIVFMLVPVIPTMVTAIVKRKPTEFLFPVFVTGLYLVAGMCYGRWHPEWVMFLTIPVYYIIAEAIEKSKKRRK